MGVINREEVPVAIQDDNVELRMSEVGDMTVSFIELKEGTDMSPASPACRMTSASARTGGTCSRAG